MFKGIVAGGGFKKLLLIILGIFLFSGLISALVVYKSSHIPLSPHYGATYTNLTRVKESLVIKTIKINIIFYALAAVGVSLLGILYSHRIAGPLFKVKQYAAVLGAGLFEERIRFRRNDAIHTLATVLNEAAEACQNRTDQIVAELKELEGDLSSLDSLPDKSKEKSELIKGLRELDSRIKEDNQKIKL
jgi:methyl-accepting chemotaxis protein